MSWYRKSVHPYHVEEARLDQDVDEQISKAVNPSVDLDTRIKHIQDQLNAQVEQRRWGLLYEREPPPPGKLLPLQYDTDERGREYVIKWVNDKGTIRTGRLLLTRKK
jgi:hypothetical protein